jgi:16S rRNA (guanine966-N2)-methyltransferase
MRIIAGKHGGRVLATPRGGAIRPTPGVVRESLFAILGDVTDIVMIDGYAGTGAIGCEAISRGAGEVWFFDPSTRAIDLVRENLEMLGELDRGHVIQKALARALVSVDRDVDFVFLDPPYGSDQPALALEALAAADCIRSGCLIVLEQDSGDDRPDHDAFELDETRTYGNTKLTFYYRK